ncbi:hypothetical protein [Nonomuraea sp. 10N515B]|uniref:hypothetical protein n=1 Tax=Nonomuraea sp. 10N515B TaxID=3457422 RepID=UPI003FCEB3A9
MRFVYLPLADLREIYVYDSRGYDIARPIMAAETGAAFTAHGPSCPHLGLHRPSALIAVARRAPWSNATSRQ